MRHRGTPASAQSFGPAFAFANPRVGGAFRLCRSPVSAVFLSHERPAIATRSREGTCVEAATRRKETTSVCRRGRVTRCHRDAASRDRRRSRDAFRVIFLTGSPEAARSPSLSPSPSRVEQPLTTPTILKLTTTHVGFQVLGRRRFERERFGFEQQQFRVRFAEKGVQKERLRVVVFFVLVFIL